MEDISKAVAQDVMASPVVSVSPDEKLKELEARLLHEQISGMPVVEKGKLIGFVSKTDVVRMDAVQTSFHDYVRDRMTWSDSEPPNSEFVGRFDVVRQLSVRDAMRPNVVTCSPLTPVPEVAREMVRNQVHRILVVDGDEPVGMISSLDLAELISKLG